jgi:peptidoglycan L-alanyl-D-glutamate endopeptidase CwlK
MPSFGAGSLAERATIHPDLQKVLDEAIKHVDFTIVEGHRGKDAQEAAFAKGLTKLHYPNGKHNSLPSRAADVMPYPIDWSDSSKNIERLDYTMGIIVGCARMLGIGVRWGGDWNMNDDTRDEGSFRDRDHLELV